MKKFLRTGAFGAVAAVALCVPAAGQTIDYGALEQLFGEPVTTSATGKPQRASEAPASIEIISAQEIERSGVTNVPDLLQRIVGLDVMRTGTDAVDVGVRGYNQPYSPRLLVLVNGRQVYLDHYSLTAWSAVPVELGEIRQIEVVKGPNTALFGFNAAGGVVNIVTYNPLYDNVNNLTVRAGTQNHREVSGVGTVKLGEKTALRLSAGGYGANEFRTPVNAIEQDSRVDPQRRSFALNGLSEIAPGHQVGVELTRSSLDRFEPLAARNGYGRTRYDTWSGKLFYNGNTPIGLVEGTLYRNKAYIGIMPIGIEANNTITVAKLQDLFKIGADHSFRVSAEYRHNELNSAPNRGGKVSYDVYSVGGMWDWSITTRVSLVNAVRLDHLTLNRTGTFTGTPPFTNEDFDRSVTEPSFNSGVVIKATDADTVRFMVGRGVQVPSMLGYAFMLDTPFMSVFGNPALKPTIVTNYELGYDRSIAAINGNLRASVYYQTNKDLMFQRNDFVLRGNPVGQFGQLGDSKAVGGEVSLKGRVGTAFGWKVGYAFERVNDSFSATTFNFEDSSPRHKLMAELDYRDGPWAANLFGQYVSATKGLRETDALTMQFVDVPASFTLSGRIGYDITENLTVSLVGQNITQKTARLTPFAAEERRALLSLTARF